MGVSSLEIQISLNLFFNYPYYVGFVNCMGSRANVKINDIIKKMQTLAIKLLHLFQAYLNYIPAEKEIREY